LYECPSCGIRADHRYNCRLRGMRRAITDALATAAAMIDALTHGS